MAAISEELLRSGTARSSGRWQPLERGGPIRLAMFRPTFRYPGCDQCLSPAAALFDQLHPSYAGDLGIVAESEAGGAAIKSADLIVALGGRLEPYYRARAIGSSTSPRQKCSSTCIRKRGGAWPRSFVRILLSTPRRHALRGARRTGHAEAHRAGGLRPKRCTCDYLPGRMWQLRSRGASILAPSWSGCARRCRSTQFCATAPAITRAWIHRFYRFRRFGTHVAPASGSMGYGVPAAVAMKLLRPERLVLSLSG